jgi:hypothetical protein
MPIRVSSSWSTSGTCHVTVNENIEISQEEGRDCDYNKWNISFVMANHIMMVTIKLLKCLQST